MADAQHAYQHSIFSVVRDDDYVQLDKHESKAPGDHTASTTGQGRADKKRESENQREKARRNAVVPSMDENERKARETDDPHDVQRRCLFSLLLACSRLPFDLHLLSLRCRLVVLNRTRERVRGRADQEEEEKETDTCFVIQIHHFGPTQIIITPSFSPSPPFFPSSSLLSVLLLYLVI